jgi:hypothetical protein
MKRYFVFAFSHYYPSGGMADCVDKCETLEEATEMLREVGGSDYSYIYDAVENKTYQIEDLVAKSPVTEENIEF